MDLNEMKAALDGGKINENGEIDPALGDFIIDSGESLSQDIKTYMSENDWDDDEFDPLNRFSKQLKLISWCYPISTKKVEESRANRLKSMFCGPFFTSERFPWPEIDGRYAEPIVQINLREIYDISPAKLCDGMLQLWAGEFGSDDFLIRIIDNNDLIEESISPVPQEITKNYYGDVRWGSDMVAWPDDDYNTKSPCVYVFSKIESPKLSWPSGLEDMFEWIDGNISDSELIKKIEEFISIFPYDHPSTEPHLFGTFDAIQYDPIDTNATFLALEGGPCFNWNYGNAQISYRQNDEGEVEFGVAWSCQ